MARFWNVLLVVAATALFATPVAAYPVGIDVEVIVKPGEVWRIYYDGPAIIADYFVFDDKNPDPASRGIDEALAAGGYYAFKAKHHVQFYVFGADEPTLGEFGDYTEDCNLICSFVFAGTPGMGGLAYYTDIYDIKGTFAVDVGSGSLIRVERLSPVPLPAALPLLLSGLAGLGFSTWRRKRQPSTPSSAIQAAGI